MSEQVLLAILTTIVSVATVGGTAWAAWMTYRTTALKTEQDKNAVASKVRYDKLNETCREVKEETAAQTVTLAEIKGDATAAAKAAGVAADLTQSALARQKPDNVKGK